MPLFAVFRAISRYSRSLRYGDLNSSHRHLIRAKKGDFKTTKRPFHQSLRAFEQTSDHNLKVNTDRNHIYGKVASVHVNKTRNMASEQGGTGINTSQKKNDDISLPFWIFLWSLLAIIAGFIYSKLNRQREIESESCGNHTTNDERIARKLVNEIAKKDSVKKPTFRRQRSYEIIDGEVRIHYDVSMLEDSLYKRANIEGVLKTAEVESIPIQNTSLEDLEFVYPGKLPLIVEEGDEELLEDKEQAPSAASVDIYDQGSPDFQIYENKGKDTQINTAKVDNSSKENTSNFEANGLHGKWNEFPTNFETIRQERLIPTESVNDANKITIDPQKDNYDELSRQTEMNLKENKNEMDLNEISECDESSSGDSVTEMSNQNSLHNSNTTSNSVYKLTQVEKTQEHKFTVTRREITKLKSNKEISLKSDSFKDETSFPFVETKATKETAEIGDNSSQLSRDLKSDSLISQQGMQIKQSRSHSNENIEVSDSLLLEKGTEEHETFQVSLNEVCNDYHSYEKLDRQKLNDSNFQQESSKLEQIVKELSSGDVYERPDTSLDTNESIVELSTEDINECPDNLLQEPCVLTCLEEGSDILVDTSGDILFKVIGPTVDEAYLEDTMENNEGNCKENNVGEFTIDENQNVDRFRGNELAKNWKSLPSWEGAHINHCELNSNSCNVDDIDLEKNVTDDTKIADNSDNYNVNDIDLENVTDDPKIEVDNPGVVHVGYLEVKKNELEQNNSGITNERFPMQNAEELIFNEDIKEADLLTFENKIGSRKTMFVKDAAEPVQNKNNNSQESMFVETGLNNNTTVVRDVEMFGDIHNENNRPDILEDEISDEIIVAEPAIQTHEVEAECSIPGQADTDDPVLFARASILEEDVLVAKVIANPEPSEMNFDLSGPGKTTVQSCEAVLKNSETINNKSIGKNCAMNLTEAEINMATLETIHTIPEQKCTAYTNTNVPNTENSQAYSGIKNGDFKLRPKTQTISESSIQTEVMQTKVHSIVRKFEEARKPNSSIQTENGNVGNGNTNLNNDIHEPTMINKSHELTSEDVVNVESQSVESSISINCNEDDDISQNNMPKDPELVGYGQISEQAIFSTIVGENEETRLETDIKSVVDDSQISEQVPIPASIVETKPNLSNEPYIISDSTNFVETVPNSMEFVADNSELKSASDKITSSNDLQNKLELESDTDIKNVGETVEDPEEIVIYANQVTEVSASDCFGESYAIGETDEAIQARPVDDCKTTVVYASQITDSENTAETYCEDENNVKQPNGNTSGGLNKTSKDKGTTVVYANQFTDTEGITVTYTSQVSENEVTSQPILLETTNPSHTKIISPTHITEEYQISNQETSDMDLSNPAPISPQPNNEIRSFRETSFDATPLRSSPLNNHKIPSPSSPSESVDEIKEDILSFDKISSNSITDPATNQSPSEVQENIPSLDKLPSSSGPVPVSKQSPSELRQSLPCGETDVDSLSDIDEIDIDILPGETHQKSKSVTDLDEAFASFGGLDDLSSNALDQDNVTAGLSKSVPDILDSCREESIRETVANPIEKLQKKNLSLSTPEINSKTKSGSKKVTKIKIVHVKFLEMQSDSENVEEDSFIYEGELPITGKMKRKSRNLSDEFSSPVASPPPDLNREVAQERWIAEKTNLKQLEFEFGDLFQNTPSPPPLEANDVKDESSTDGLNRDSRNTTGIHEDATKFQDASIVNTIPDNSPYETSDQISTTSESQDCTLPDSSTQRPSLTEVKNQSFGTINASTVSSTNSSKLETQSQRTVSSQRAVSRQSTLTYYKTSTTVHSKTHISSDLKSDIERSSENVAPSLPIETKVTSSNEKLHQTSNIIRSSTIMSSGTKSSETVHGTSKRTHESCNSETNLRVESQNAKDNATSISSESVPQASKKTVSYRYSPGNTHSYSKVPKLVPEEGKYVVKAGLTQSTTKQNNIKNSTTQARYIDSPSSSRNITTQARYVESSNSPQYITTKARYTDSPHLSSPTNSPRHGLKLTEKFRMSEETQQQPGLTSNVLSSNRTSSPVYPANQTRGQVIPNDRTDGPKTRKPNQRGSSSKGTSRHAGRMVTVKSGIISDYECSSDADSEMSYNVPSPRVKAKRFHRPQVHRVDSASSSEPDSPRRQMKDDRRSMSELFGVDEGSQYSSDTSKDGGDGKENSLRNQQLFSRFGNVGQNEEPARRQDETFVESNPSPSCVYQGRATIFDPRPIQPEANMEQNKERVARHSEERNLSPRNISHARATTFDQRPPDSKTYNPRYTNVLERNLSPTSFLQEGNLGDDQMSPKTMEFNPFEDIAGQDGFQPFERCHSPSSVYSDTSSVFSFNCDFDPMPPPTGQYEPEVYTCENPMCKKQDILLGPEKTSFRSCPACFTYYCSSECRKLHWASHKQSCYFGRVNTYVRSIIRLCQRREDLSMYLSQLARDGYKKKGRGVVMAIFNSPELAREFITKGHDAFSGRKPTFSSLTDLHREGIISKHRVALMQAVRDYEPNQEFVFNIAVVATNNIPIIPAPRYKLNTVLHCIKMPLNDLIVARQPNDYDKVETRLFALPKCSRHEFVNEMEARRHYCRNLSKNLRQYNIKLKEDYPECYRKLCMYVEHNISFEPMTVYGQRGGLSYKCVIAPEQSYPLNAEYC